MTIQELRKQAAAQTTTCHGCKECNGRACRGEIPGMGGKGSGSSFVRNVDMLKQVRLRLDTIGDDRPIDTSRSFFGHPVSLPVYGAPIAGMKAQYGCEMSELAFAKGMIEGAKAAGTLSFVGDGKDVQMFASCAQAVKEAGGIGVCTMKPWERKGVDERLALFADTSAYALACDVDASGLLFLRNTDPRITTFSKEEIRYVKQRCGAPFIVKGIMTAEGAMKAWEAGADGIVVSNHGGRVLDDAQATIEVLPEICDAVKGRMQIFIDGGFRSGVDVFKALALGADGVLIGRPLALCCIGAQADGVKQYLEQMQLELREAMMMTGCHSLADITPEKIINVVL